MAAAVLNREFDIFSNLYTIIEQTVNVGEKIPYVEVAWEGQDRRIGIKYYRDTSPESKGARGQLGEFIFMIYLTQIVFRATYPTTWLQSFKFSVALSKKDLVPIFTCISPYIGNVSKFIKQKKEEFEIPDLPDDVAKTFLCQYREEIAKLEATISSSEDKKQAVPQEGAACASSASGAAPAAAAASAKKE